jgi:hypothetical protein
MYNCVEKGRDSPDFSEAEEEPNLSCSGNIRVITIFHGWDC